MKAGSKKKRNVLAEKKATPLGGNNSPNFLQMLTATFAPPYPVVADF